MTFFIFMICLFCGVLSGTVYDVLYIARCILCGTDKENYTVKDKIFIAAADVIYCLVFAAGYIFMSVMFDFEGLRFYMLLGCALGALMYLKSFHVIVAFSVNKVYNKIAVKLKSKLKSEKKLERAKKKPHRRGNHHKRNIADSRTRNRRSVSARGDGDGSKAEKRVYRGNSKIQTTD